MKTGRHMPLFCICALPLMCLLASAKADIVSQVVTAPTNAIAVWPRIDFDGDGTEELSFQPFAMFFEGGPTAFYLTAKTSTNTEVLSANGNVLALPLASPISDAPNAGQWQAAGFRCFVWSQLSETGNTNLPGEGVGMPGYGEFLGIRFQIGSEWHYGWVRFGLLDLSSFPIPVSPDPSVLEYAYERQPGVQILAGAKPVLIPLALPETARPGYMRLTWIAQIGTSYQVQSKTRLDDFSWTNVGDPIPATITNMTAELPIEGTCRFFRVIEAD